jgi:hypothetical protein
MKRHARLAVVCLVVAIFLAGSLAAADCLKCQVKRYTEAVQNGDLDGALSYLAEEFQLRYAGSEKVVHRDDLAPVLGWDHAVNGRLSLESLEWEGQTVTAVVRERSDFLDLVGIDTRTARVTFRFDDDGRIVEQIYEPVSEPKCVCKVVKPVVDWAKEHRVAELSAVTRDGEPVYTAETAGPWLALLTDWRDSVAGDAGTP